MRIGDAFPSNYLKAKDLKGQEVPLVIDSVTVEDIGSGEKPVVRFVNNHEATIGQCRNRGIVLAVLSLGINLELFAYGAAALIKTLAKDTAARAILII